MPTQWGIVIWRILLAYARATVFSLNLPVAVKSLTLLESSGYTEWRHSSCLLRIDDLATFLGGCHPDAQVPADLPSDPASWTRGLFNIVGDASDLEEEVRNSDTVEAGAR